LIDLYWLPLAFNTVSVASLAENKAVTGIISGIKGCSFKLLTLKHECLLIRALIEHSNTLIEQSDHLATETRISIIMGIIG